jgi:hypothetical protein
MANTRAVKKPTATRRNEVADDGPLADEAELARDMLDYLKEYAREKPEVAALWCFGIGFVLGWKLKPW